MIGILKKFSPRYRAAALCVSLILTFAETGYPAEILVSQQNGYLTLKRPQLKFDKKGAKLVGSLYSKHFDRVKQGSHMHIQVYDAEGTLLENINESTDRRVFHQRHKRDQGYIFPDHIVRLQSDYGEIALIKIYVYSRKHYDYEVYDN